MISTRGRYALRVLIDLAENQGEGYTPLKDVAERQNISLKYLERILPSLTKNGYIEGLHGRGGGYRLTLSPQECRVGDILCLTEGDMAPVACLTCGADPCDQAEHCPTLPMWKGFHEMTKQYFDGITVADLMKKPEKSSGCTENLPFP